MASLTSLARQLRRAGKPECRRVNGKTYVHLTQCLILLLKYIYGDKMRDKTPAQNRFFHGVAVPFLAELMGHDVENRLELKRVRENIKNTWGAKIESVDLLTGIVTQESKSISDYTIDDFRQVISGVDLYCYDMYGCRLPEPNSEKAKDMIDEYT